ncbi:MAG: type III secretion protein [Deltaproteobacteria bacterium]|jgi:type III secretion protein X|nr:type III secretion protein [Deltaproteobacteria bacterium]
MSLSIFDPSVGVQTVLEPLTEDVRLPGARQLSTSVISQPGLADLFTMPTFSTSLKEAMRPEIRDDGLLRPDVILKNLREASRHLKDVKSPDVRRFVRDDLDPLLDDTQLLATYAGLLLEG